MLYLYNIIFCFIIVLFRTNSKIHLTILASGSEVEIAIEASKKLQQEKIYSKVISVPCQELFELQNSKYKNKILINSSMFFYLYTF